MPSALDVSADDQQRFQGHLLAAIQDSVIFTDLQGRIAYWNRGAEKLFGYTAEEILGQTPALLYPSADPTTLALDLTQIKAGQPYVGTWEGRRKDGATVWLDVTTTLVQDANGTPIGFLGLAKDATERRRLESALREREEGFRMLVTTSSDVVYRMSPDWCEMRQLEGREFIADTLEPSQSWLDKYIHPDDQPHVMAAIAEAVRTKGVFDLEHRVLRTTGTFGWTHSRAIPILDHRGAIVEWLGTASDVTQRRTAEDAARQSEAEADRQRRLYEAILANTPDLAYVFDRNHRFIYANEGLLKMWGRTWADAIGKNCLELGYEPWHAAMHDREIEQVVATQQPIRGEVPFTGTFGRRTYDYIFVPVLNAQGEVEAVAGTTRDVTEQKQTEGRLRQSAKMEAVGRLAGGIAHDFNNQLQAVAGFANFAARDPALGPAARHDLEQVQKATERMAGLTRQLLAFSRQQILQPQTLDLNAAVAEGWSLLGRLIGSRIEIVLELASEPMWIHADPAQLLQVLMNLALNARDAMPEGGQLRVCTGRREITSAEPPQAGTEPIPPGCYVKLSVSDSGIGIAPEHFPHLFESFFTTKDVGQGTGLGLATVHGIVTQSTGHIWVESTLGRGTTFVVLLPEVPAGTAPVSLFRSSDPQHRPARILVVDDDEMVRTILARSLEAERYEVLQAGHAQEALDQLARAGGGIDLVLSDIVMPGIGCREFGERLAAEHPDLLIAFMSGYARDLLTDDGVAATVPFLQKPIAPDVLVNTVRDMLARRGVSGAR